MRYEKYALIVGILLFPLFLFLYPLSQIVFNSFSVGGNYVRFFEQPMYRQALLNSLGIAFFSTVLIAPVALLIVSATRRAVRAKKVVRLLTSLPLVFSSYVFCTALIYIYGQAGIVNELLRFVGLQIPMSMFSVNGIVLANVLFFLPYFIVPLFYSFEELNPLLEEAATSLGSKGFYTFRRVVFPQVCYGFAMSCLITFLLVFNQISVVLALGTGKITTLTYLMFGQYEMDYAMANTIATMSLCVTFGVALVFQLAGERLWK